MRDTIGSVQSTARTIIAIEVETQAVDADPDSEIHLVLNGRVIRRMDVDAAIRMRLVRP